MPAEKHPELNVKRRGSIELCTRRNMVVYHQKMELFDPFLMMYCGDQHTAGIDAHHRSWRQIDDCNAGLAHKLLRLVICVNTA